MCQYGNNLNFSMSITARRINEKAAGMETKNVTVTSEPKIAAGKQSWPNQAS